MDIQILSGIRLDDSNQGNLIATRHMNSFPFDNNLASGLKHDQTGDWITGVRKICIYPLKLTE